MINRWAWQLLSKTDGHSPVCRPDLSSFCLFCLCDGVFLILKSFCHFLLNTFWFLAFHYDLVLQWTVLTEPKVLVFLFLYVNVHFDFRWHIQLCCYVWLCLCNFIQLFLFVLHFTPCRGKTSLIEAISYHTFVFPRKF